MFSTIVAGDALHCTFHRLSAHKRTHMSFFWSLSSHSGALLQIVASLLSFPAAAPALPAELQRTALVAQLLTFAPDSALSALPASAAPQQQQRSFPADPQLETYPGIEQNVLAALEAMSALGHESLLSNTALPVLYATAAIGYSPSRPSGASDQVSGQANSNRPGVRAATGEEAAATGDFGRDEWRRATALQGLARIACASSALRQPILQSLTEAIPNALAGAAAVTHCQRPTQWPDFLRIPLRAEIGSDLRWWIWAARCRLLLLDSPHIPLPALFPGQSSRETKDKEVSGRPSGLVMLG